jgi:hypothetical protein
MAHTSEMASEAGPSRMARPSARSKRRKIDAGMRSSRKVIVVILTIAVAGSIAALLLIYPHEWLLPGPSHPVTLQGTVLVSSTDVDKQEPVPGVRISVAASQAEEEGWSSSTGFFRLTLPARATAGQQPVLLQFRQPQYQPVDLPVFPEDGIYMVRMVPIGPPSRTDTSAPHVVVSHVTVRYTVKTRTLLNVGSVVKTFRVANTANEPCHARWPCSPDEKWKASVGSATLNAPAGNVFSNARVSCIAGPCPFTRIRSDNFSPGGPTISVSILNWADTATFLFEAEVFRPMISDSVRTSYPVIFGSTLNFIMPADAEGVCIEADVNRAPIVFPLGPDLRLSWASCAARTNPDSTKVYRCELKPGYDFQ